MVNPDGLSAAELAALRGLQRCVPTPLADDPVWDRLGAEGFKLVKLCEKDAGTGTARRAHPRADLAGVRLPHGLTSRVRGAAGMDIHSLAYPKGARMFARLRETLDRWLATRRKTTNT